MRSVVLLSVRITDSADSSGLLALFGGKHSGAEETRVSIQDDVHRHDGEHRIERNALHIWPRGGFGTRA